MKINLITGLWASGTCKDILDVQIMMQIVTIKIDSSWNSDAAQVKIKRAHIKDGTVNAWILGWNSSNREPNAMSYGLKQQTERRNSGKTRNTKIWNLLVSRSHLLSYCIIMHIDLVSSPHMLIQLQVTFPYAT